jgi:hypothetical protein
MYASLLYNSFMPTIWNLTVLVNESGTVVCMLEIEDDLKELLLPRMLEVEDDLKELLLALLSRSALEYIYNGYVHVLYQQLPDLYEYD